MCKQTRKGKGFLRQSMLTTLPLDAVCTALRLWNGSTGIRPASLGREPESQTEGA